MAAAWDGTLAAIVGGLAGAIAGIAATTLTNKTNRTAGRIEKRIDDIEAAAELLRVEAISYWSTAGAGDSSVARKIITLWETVVTKVDSLEDFKNQVGDLGQVNACIDKLYDLITGSDFQAKYRSADQDKVAEIRGLCTSLCSHLHTSRRLVNRWRHFWKRRSISKSQANDRKNGKASEVR
ncbi:MULTISPECIES: hypothetical protein [Stenotrophomonas]|uniref:hypothetical protein n=1 Tax=Stenotrophomonas TaxID=40323 RepID=UPI001140E95A|nr:hypothetical protein [Stenotrophomonas maltophilia]